jgi:hypothetical protein
LAGAIAREEGSKGTLPADFSFPAFAVGIGERVGVDSASTLSKIVSGEAADAVAGRLVVGFAERVNFSASTVESNVVSVTALGANVCSQELLTVGVSGGSSVGDE